MIVRHPTYRRSFSISDHSIQQIRNRCHDRDIKCENDVDLRNLVDRQLVEAFQAQKFEIVRDMGEPLWIVPLWDDFVGLNALLKTDRDRYRTHCEKALLTVITDEMVARNKAGKGSIRWVDPKLNDMTFKLGDKMTTVNNGKPASQAVVAAETVVQLPKKLTTNGAATKEIWAIRYPVDDEVGHKWEEVDKAVVQGRVTELIGFGIEPTSILVYKPVKAKISVSFDDT